MPEEVAPDESLDTPESPEPAAPEDSTEGTPAQEPTDGSTDYEERYTNLNQAYSKQAQELGELRAFRSSLADPETQQELFRALAKELEYELEEEELEAQQTETPAQDPALVQLLEERATEKYEAELDSLATWVEGKVENLAKAGQIELSPDETDAIFALLTPGDSGDPDVERAFKKVTGLRDSAIKSYVAGKRTAPQAPSGSSATQNPNLDDREARREYMLQKLRAAQ